MKRGRRRLKLVANIKCGEDLEAEPGMEVNMDGDLLHSRTPCDEDVQSYSSYTMCFFRDFVTHFHDLRKIIINQIKPFGRYNVCERRQEGNRI